MNSRLRPFLCSLLLGAGAPIAQQPTDPARAETTSAAETAYRAAWWAESGKNDLETALAGYLTAAAADGPKAVRARALAAAGAAQQRLGKADAAIATFQQVLRDYPEEAEAVSRARAFLADLTAVDLREGYDEWYDRRMFGETAQIELLGAIDLLGQTGVERSGVRSAQELVVVNERSQGLRRRILAFGKAAVPALRRAAQSADEALAGEAISLLFRLDEVPPTAVLLANPSWVGDADAWASILRRRAGMQPPPAGGAAGLVPPLLAAAMQGPAALAAALGGANLPSVSIDELGPVQSAARAVLLVGDEAARRELVATMKSATAPLRVRMAIEDAIADDSQLPLALNDWVDLAQKAQRFQLRLTCLQAAAMRLRPGDESVLDGLLSLVADAPANGLGDAAAALLGGLQCNPAGADLAWTAPLLVRTLTTARHGDPSTLQVLITDLRREARVDLVAAAVFGEAAAAELVTAWRLDAEGDSLGDALSAAFCVNEGDERDSAILARHWHRAIVALLDTAWPQWGPEQRLRAVLLLPSVIAGHERTALAEFATRVAPTAGTALQARLEQLAAEWQQ